MKLTLVIPVYISTDLHLDFTRQTLESINTSHLYDVLIVINHCSLKFEPLLNSLKTENCKLKINPKGNILAASWNLGIQQAFSSVQGSQSARAQRSRFGEAKVGSSSTQDCEPERAKKAASDFCLIVNNDIIFHPQCIDNLVAFAQSHPEFLLWSASVWPNQRTLASAKLTSKFSLHPHFSCFMIAPQTVQQVGFFDENFSFGYFEDNDYHTRILLKGYQAAATDSAKFYHYGSRTINVDDNLKIEGKYHYQKNREYFKAKWGLDIHGKAFDPPEKILDHLPSKLLH